MPSLAFMRNQKKQSLRKIKEQIANFIRDPDSGPSFEVLAADLFRLQLDHNESYARFCRMQGVDEWPGDWRRVPALPQSAFKEALVAAFDIAQAEAVFHTSGTTGPKPGRHFMPSLELYRLAVTKGWRHAGLPTLPAAILMPHPAQEPHSSLSRMIGFLCDTGGVIPEHAWGCHADGTFDAELVRNFLAKQRQRSQPVILFGTALSLWRWLETGGGPLPEGSWIFQTGGFKGVNTDLQKPDLYQRFSEQWGVPDAHIIDEYGMTELTSQFYALGVNGPHRAPPWMKAWVVDPETGREAARGGTGILRIIDLANIGSALALETRDLAVADGDGFLLLGRDPKALPRGCSRAADERIGGTRS